MLSPRDTPPLNRALSTPPQTPSSPNASFATFKQASNVADLTPPVSPVLPRHSRSASNLSHLDHTMSSLAELKCSSSIERTIDDTKQIPATTIKTEDGILICPFNFNLAINDNGRETLLGSGAWSNVFKAYPDRRSSSTHPLTPPPSPTGKALVMAVKRPARRDAVPILRNEASILTYLLEIQDKEQCQHFIIPFYGIKDDSLVMRAVRLNMADYVRECAAISSRSPSSTGVPVVGSTKRWLQLAHRLISTLVWLHEVAGVVHGDIKPGNIVLVRHTLPSNSRQESFDRDSTDDDYEAEDFPLKPLLIDFSSSHVMHPSPDIKNPPSTRLGTLSAVTREYTAPELLKSSVLRDPASTATMASDVFSLAITLLVAATGNLLVYEGDVLRRVAQASQGWQCISLMQNSRDGLRIPRMGVVQRMTERAVLKNGGDEMVVAMGRVDARTWLGIVEEELARGEPVKKTALLQLQ